jgi:hypothetical protein
MAPIFAQMDRDLVRPAELCQNRSMNRIRLNRSSSLSHGGDMINVDSQKWHERRYLYFQVA